MKIKAKVELSKVEQWSTDWKNESEKANELKKLEWDMKMAIYERCGVDLSNISIELEVSEERESIKYINRLIELINLGDNINIKMRLHHLKNIIEDENVVLPQADVSGSLPPYEDCNCPDPFKCLRICHKLIKRCGNDH